MPITYEARGRVYVVIEDRVSTELFSFTDAVRDRLLTALTYEAQKIASAARGPIGAHGTGELGNSVKATKARAFKDVSVRAGVKMGGTRSTKHGHLFERGFAGEETVRAHQRSSKLGSTSSLMGAKFDVKAYKRQVSYRAHGILETCMNARHSSLQRAVMDAISGTAAERGLS